MTRHSVAHIVLWFAAVTSVRPGPDATFVSEGSYSIRSVSELRLEGKWDIVEGAVGWYLVPGPVQGSRLSITCPPEFGVRSNSHAIHPSVPVVVDIFYAERVVLQNKDVTFARDYERAVIGTPVPSSAELKARSPISKRGECVNGLIRLCYVVAQFKAQEGRGPFDMKELTEYGASVNKLSSVNTRDPWGREFVYGEVTSDVYRIYEFVTLGEDGKVGGEADDADVRVIWADK